MIATTAFAAAMLLLGEATTTAMAMAMTEEEVVVVSTTEAVVTAARSMGVPLRTLLVVLAHPGGKVGLGGVGRALLRWTRQPRVALTDMKEHCAATRAPSATSGELTLYVGVGVGVGVGDGSSVDPPCAAVRGAVKYSVYHGKMVAFAGGVDPEAVAQMVEATGPNTGVLLVEREAATGNVAVGEVFSTGEGRPARRFQLLTVVAPAEGTVSVPPEEEEDLFVWRRRADLQSRRITAITERWLPFIEEVVVVVRKFRIAFHALTCL